MKRVICVVALCLICGCATSGKLEVVDVDMDLRSDKRVALEEGKAAPAEGRVASVPIVGPIIELLKGKPGRLKACLCRIEWGKCPDCGKDQP